MTDTNKLEGRIAQCSYDGHGKIASDEGLAFFEFQGEGSYSAELCKCGFTENAHNTPPRTGRPMNPKLCDNYRPRGDVGHDKYYCGCRGWD